MNRYLTGAFAALMLGLPANAGDGWLIAPEASSIGFTYTHEKVEKTGRFEQFTATIVFNREAPDQAHLQASIDLASVTTGDNDANDALKSSDWFSVEDNPVAVFESTRVEHTPEGGFIAHGSLTIKALTLPIDLPFTLEITDDTANARGQVSLNRLAYHLGEGFWSSPAFLGHEVLVTVDLTATRIGPD